MQEDVLFDLVIKDIISVNTMYSAGVNSAKRRNRPQWGIILKWEGETEYFCGEKKYRSDLMNVMLLPKGSSYEWVSLRSGRCSIVDFDCDLCCGEIFSFPCADSEKLLRMFRELERKCTVRGRAYRMEGVRILYEILLTVLKPSEKVYVSSGKRDKLRVPLEYIAENYSRNIKNSDLAALTPYSTVYFRKLFQEVTGVSPIQYIQALRMQKAKEMLCSDYGSITDIALSVGYTNIYEFSRAFKKYTGMSPSQYLKIKNSPGPESV